MAQPHSDLNAGEMARETTVQSVSLRSRCRHAELMDHPCLDAAEHWQALRGLARINWLSRSDAIAWPGIRRLVSASHRSTIRVLDLASGGGDVPIALAKRAQRAGLSIHVEGCDISAQAVQFAEARARQLGLAVPFFKLDVLNDAIPQGFDVLTCSLFLHHLEADAAIAFLRKSAAATSRLFLVNDLLRGPAEFALAWTVCRMVTRSRVVHHDGPASVAGAFTAAEARGLVQKAGLEGAILTKHWPRRFLLSWSH
jgi:2-polyprenyl-3-methyl-5-hydroxy-6-metoxy-1,4-benzoquinol methylase